MQKHRGPRVWLLAIGLCAVSAAMAEDWLGYEGGGPRRNASAADVAPEKLAVSWVRRFDRQVVIGRNMDPVSEEERIKWGSLHGAFGSRNLAIMDGRIAVIAADHAQPIPTNARDAAWLTLLDHATGKTLNCIHVAVNPGKAGIWGWPRAPWTDANDLLIGQVVLAWDPQTKACFVSVGGDTARYAAYLPDANLNSYVPGGFQAGAAAFEGIREHHAQLQDAFGRPRSNLTSIYAPAAPSQPMANETADWGPSLVPKDDAGKHSALDKDLPVLLPHPGWYAAGIYQNNNCNRTAFIAVDAEGPTIAMGQAWHCDASSYYLANKWNGLCAMAEPLPPLCLIDEEGREARYPHARPFAKWGGLIVHCNRMYGMSPGTDDDGSGQLGLGGGASWMNRGLDQGLGLWAYDLAWEDQRPNDGVTGPAAAETAAAKLAWGWSRKSTSPKGAKNESWQEVDGLYRNKAMLVDHEGALWVIWTRSLADGIELVEADHAGQKGWLLGIGKGRPGSESWPHLALAARGTNRWLVAYAGNAWHRSKGPYTLPDSNCAAKAGDNVDFAWATGDGPPSGPAELAVFDLATASVTTRLDFSKLADDLPPNEFFGYTDRSHLVVAGHHAYVGWVGARKKGEAELVLCALDLTAPQGEPVIRRFPLGFSAEVNPASALIDLTACDGQLCALIYRSDVLNYGDHRWYEQVVVALREKNEGKTP